MTKLTVTGTYALKPNDSHVSFYGKANVIVLSNGVRLLQSYDTIVAGINTSGNLVKVWNGFSATTARHISAFSEQYAGKKLWEAKKVDKAFCKRYGDFCINAKFSTSYPNWWF